MHIYTIRSLSVLYIFISGILICAVESDASTLRVMEPKLFLFHITSLLCEPKHEEPTRICTGIHLGCAFSPLIPIHITYIGIKLYDPDFRPIVLLWKPFHRCFVYFRIDKAYCMY